MKKSLRIVYYGMSLLLIFIAIALPVIKEWVFVYFGEIDFQQILFLLLSPMEGTNNNIIVDFIIHCIFPPFLITILIFAIFIFLIKIQTKKQNKLLDKIIVLFRKKVLFFSVFAIFISYGFVSEEMGVNRYLQAFFHDSNIFEKYYVDPLEVEFSFPEEKRNLVYIFLESMETTYYSVEEGGAQEINLIPELYQLAEENITFTNSSGIGLKTAKGSTWTVAAMVAQTAGIPLKVNVDANSYGIDSEFLPGATSLGDILEKAGYNQMLMVGSNASFGGRRSYFKQHGNYEIFDYYTAVVEELIPSDYYVWWGYEDFRLFEYAKMELTDLASREEPFNFTMLTVDTHFADGYICPYCGNEHDSQYANVMSCSSKQVYAFIRWIQEQDFYKNTTIVIAGDHLSMDNQFFVNLDEDYERQVYYTIINSATDFNGKDRELTTFDMFPTTLAAMGITTTSDRLGLGTNAFSDSETLLELLGLDELNSQIDMNSKYWNKNILCEE